MLRCFVLLVALTATQALAQDPLSTAINSAIGEERQESAQPTADPRAVEYCTASPRAFTEVAECLPEAHVSIIMLDHFEREYPATAQPIRARCLDLNDELIAARACIMHAIEDALKLASQLPTGTSLDDPVFSSLLDARLFADLKDATDRAKRIAPDKFSWGGTLYTPYR